VALPDSIVIGSPKCATTAICAQLAAHPQICFSRPKETFFFCWDDRYARGLDWYRTCFQRQAEHIAVGEGTTLYTCLDTYPQTLSRITRHLGRPKIVLAARDPFVRAQSYWQEMRSQGRTMKPFAIALRANTEYIDGSLYHRTLAAYRDAIGPENVHVILYDDFAASATSEIGRCLAFLGVDPTLADKSADGVVYPSEGKREDLPLTNAFRRRLPGFETLRNACPPAIRTLVARSMKRPIRGRPGWDTESATWMLDRVADDTRRFLTDIGRPELEASWLDPGRTP